MLQKQQKVNSFQKKFSCFFEKCENTERRRLEDFYWDIQKHTYSPNDLLFLLKEWQIIWRKAIKDYLLCKGVFRGIKHPLGLVKVNFLHWDA